MPEIVKTELRLASTRADGTPEAVGDLLRMQGDDTAMGGNDDPGHDLRRKDDGAVALVGFWYRLDHPEIILIPDHGLGDADTVP